MAEIITTDSQPDSCPDCGGVLNEVEELESIDGETASNVLSCEDCDFRGTGVWDFKRFERLN